MQKDKNRFIAEGGQYLGKAPLTDAQKKEGKKVAAYLRSLQDEEKEHPSAICAASSH